MSSPSPLPPLPHHRENFSPIPLEDFYLTSHLIPVPGDEPTLTISENFTFTQGNVPYFSRIIYLVVRKYVLSTHSHSLPKPEIVTNIYCKERI
jgi:hypothetical protein